MMSVMHFKVPDSEPQVSDFVKRALEHRRDGDTKNEAAAWDAAARLARRDGDDKTAREYSENATAAWRLLLDTKRLSKGG